MHSNEPRCFAGDHLEAPEPSCELQCAEQQCLLMNPQGGGVLNGNNDNRRVLSEEESSHGRELMEEAGEDVLAPKYYPGTLPLHIPTLTLKPGTMIPAKLMNLFL